MTFASGDPPSGGGDPSARSAHPSARSAHPSSSSSDPSGPAPRLRLFVALELPAAARAALVAFRDEAAEPRIWRPVPDEALHLTLAFLGHRPEGDVETISRDLCALTDPAPRLALGSALLLPPRRSRVLTVSLADLDGTLATLQGHVSDALEEAGVFVPEKRPFRAHATVARLRPRERAPRSVDAEPVPLEFRADTVTLFVSRLHPRGARYEALSRVTLR
ncbi:MAG TPA: RNA 2',3'-cyclic phosphodiesterase [Solirubrobacteraceae bacterium]|nr:RNA 2',3'-cyclic phosphodiesterase [Solirubrobacteraceae bacterium]